MPSERHMRIREVFLLAVEAAESDRVALLDRLCESDVDLRREVAELLRASRHADAESFMSDPTGESSLARTGAEGPGSVIGPYKLIEEIGEGGFGVVYMAEQKSPVKRRVALKIIKHGMDTRSVIARFEAERQALAVMDHPNIARVYDAGATETGRPYFVMELIRGVPLLEYCNREELDTKPRLELFVAVCNAIQHAHQKGVIHRDIKPSNVLVTLHDGKPVPKVIDFGIAKATNAELAGKTLFTQHRQMIGTPAYMSPEQAEMSGLDIDTRSDVYSLGVLLYELLTGTTPFDNTELTSAGFAEMMRIIREVEPRKPSTRLSTLGRTATGAAERWPADARRLGTFLRGDLDWIVMKCLEKDRARRYDTASGIADDVQRHLTGEPVVAVPPSVGYRIGKFVRKHRALLATAATIVVLLVGGMAGTSWGFIRASRAALAEQRAKDQAVKRLLQIERGVDLFAGMLAHIDPAAEHHGGDPLYVQLRKRAEEAERELAGEAVGDALATARLQTILGSTLRGLGSHEAAIAALEKAASTRERELGDGHPDALDTLDKLAMAYHAAGRVSDAIRLHERIRDARMASLGGVHPLTLIALNNLAMAYQAAGKRTEAIRLLEQVGDAQKGQLGFDHPDALSTLNNLAGAYQAAGRASDAIPLLEQVREAQANRLGGDHAETLVTVNNLAMGYQSTGRLADAIELFEQVRDRSVKKLGPDHPDVLTMLNNLGMAYRDAGRLPEAGQLLEEVRDACARRLGSDHPDTLRALNNLALVCQATGRLTEAISLFEQVMEASTKRLGASHPHTMGTLGNLVLAYDAARQFDQAEACQLRLLPLVKETTGAQSRECANALAILGHLRLEQRRGEDAEPVLRECLALRSVDYPDGNTQAWRRHNIESMLGESLVLQGRFKEAEPLMLRSCNAMADDLAVPPADSGSFAIRRKEALQRVVSLYEAWDLAEPGLGHADQAAHWRSRLGDAMR